MRKPATRAAGAAASALSLFVLAAAAPAQAAAEGDVDVINTETVQVYMDASGKIDSKKVYEQLSLVGTGSVDIANPIEESGVRNLDGFGDVDVEDGVQKTTVDVDGAAKLRSVSDYTRKLPLEVEVEYWLDGERVEADDVVGADGALEIVYTVRNVTAVEQEVTYPDGKGGTVTETAEVPIPIVGSVTTVAPPNFADVQSKQGNVAGDGRGGTKLSFTMTLFPPVGSDQVSFGYTANITDGVVPPTSITALPVNPLDVPTFKSAGESYQSGSDTGVRLAQGATEIDSNLLRLRDGAAELLSGLIQLSDGADQLEQGLAGEAAPGAERLASGALQLDDGLGQLDDGAGRLEAGANRLRLGVGQLDAGAGELSAGAGKLNSGARQLSVGAGTLAAGTGVAVTGSKTLESGLQQISGGLSTLADSKQGLPAAAAGVDTLKAGVDQILAGFGSTTQPDTLLYGLNALEAGLGQLQGGATQLSGGLVQLRGDGSAATPGLVAAKGGVDQVEAGLTEAVEPGGTLDRLVAGLTTVQGLDCGPICDGALEQIKNDVTGPDGSKAKLTAGRDGLVEVSGGLGQALGALDTQLIPGANQIAGGLAEAKAGATKTKGGAVQLRDGVVQVSGGLDQLRTGLTKAVAGVLQLNTGAGAAYAGSSDLTDGLVKIDGGAGKLSNGAGKLAKGTGQLSAGASKLADGTGRLQSGSDELADGAGQLADGTSKARTGSGQLADGAGKLAGGLSDAADGSGRLTDGLDQAAAGAPQIVDGAGRLSDEGMSKLIDAGEATAQDYGKLYAVMAAGAERADNEKMAYGAPENALGLTAYSFEILGDDGEGGRNVTRGLVALLLVGLGLGAVAVRRRFV